MANFISLTTASPLETSRSSKTTTNRGGTPDSLSERDPLGRIRRSLSTGDVLPTNSKGKEIGEKRLVIEKKKGEWIWKDLTPKTKSQLVKELPIENIVFITKP